MGKPADYVKRSSAVLGIIISAAVATWAFSELAITWIFIDLPQEPLLSAERHAQLTVGLFLVFLVVAWWEIRNRNLWSRIRRLLPQ